VLQGALRRLLRWAWTPRLQDDHALAAALQSIARAHGQPAMAAALIRGETILARAAVGWTVRGGDRPVTLASRFHIGSTTKGLTALLLAMLVREGRLRWDDRLGSLLAEVPMREEYARATLRDLLLHRAGVMAMQLYEQEDPVVRKALWSELPEQTPDARWQRLEVARLVLNQPPIAPPGTRHVYSNLGFAILGAVAEAAAGESFESLMTRRVFAPLGMPTARLGGWPASPAEPDQPRGHYCEAGEIRPQALDDPYVFPAWMNPAGGAHCGIEDYARYARENLLGLSGKGQLLDEAGYRELHASHATVRLGDMYAPSLRVLAAAHGADVGKQKLELGYGWVSVPTWRGRVSAGDGSGGTFFARIVVFPALDLAFVAVTSTGGGAPAIGDAIRRVTGLAWS
jgi:CubicO group peptidase (beta-lactamase class C family)